jgi:phosphoribosylformylglycinamidine synthase II
MQAQIQLLPRNARQDALARQAEQILGRAVGDLQEGRLFQFLAAPQAPCLAQFANEVLADPLSDQVALGAVQPRERYHCYVVVAKRPGVTDDEGWSAQRALSLFLDQPLNRQRQTVFSQQIYWIEHLLDEHELEKLARTLFGNPLIHHFEWGYGAPTQIYIPGAECEVNAEVERFNLSQCDLVKLSDERHLALSAVELEAIRAHFGDRQATDCELEILAQTWSEHCKHKEFNARITYRNLETGERREIDSLFHTKIKGATDLIAERLVAAGQHWLVKVFSDNAGLVRIDKERLFAWKVETHNSPSALDPYGGAMTGVLGNNRDAFGTGVGGARLLFNTNVLCFAPPNPERKLLKGQLPPERVMQGVVAGIMDAGNKSGVPTVNGAIVFDERYGGKPLVYCGTGAVLPDTGKAWEKSITAGDLIVMVGGRVGKDGLHGATLSSTHCDARTPATMVQIGSPFTQKLLSDFLEGAVAAGLVKTCTDNGAGGLSSSIGELAEESGGAEVQLEKVPLKYSGLKPWEIFVSESQERMTLVVDPANVEELVAFGAKRGVECSQIGRFTDSGRLNVHYEQQQVADLDLEFLHHGVPQKRLEAEWQRPAAHEPALPDIIDYNAALLSLLSAPNICSRASVIRRYDHEVKGKSIIKPLMGASGQAPQDAAVMRLSWESYEGIAISNGITPRYGDLDPYASSAGAFDEAVRQIIAVGGRLPDLSDPDGPYWTVNDNFCVPDSVYDPVHNPDGKLKLAKLVQMCDALYDMATAYNVPLTSGKDSMKNDFRDGATKISVPPTVLYSMVAEIRDVREATTAEFKAAGDLIYLLGETYDELGGSEFYRLFEELGSHVPVVRPESASDLYRRVTAARPYMASCHDLSDGGLAVALAEAAFGGELGAEVELKYPRVEAALFSESHSRFIATVPPELQQRFEAILGMRCRLLGKVTEQPKLRVQWQGEIVVDQPLEELQSAWKTAPWNLVGNV